MKWYFADVDASRMRMGLSHQTLTLMEKTCAMLNSGGARARGDSSETEEQFRQRCKAILKSWVYSILSLFYVVVNICHLYYNAVRRFYALDYTEQDFSDSASRDAEKKATKGFFFHSRIVEITRQRVLILS